MACSSFAGFLGDWKIWTPVQTARMSVLRSGKTVFTATTGGVMEWDPVLSKGTMHTGLQGIPSLDIASILADSSGRIWAICADGHIAVLDAGASSWTSVGSYGTSGWTFLPGAATFWKGYLLLGGPKGLSIFSTNPTDPNYLTAVDNISAFGSIRNTVTSVMAQNDTIWVSTPDGIALATNPVWNTDSASKQIGKAGYYLSADRWNVQTATTNSAYILLRDSTGVHLGLSGQWSDFANGLSIDSGVLRWKGGSATIPGANHALSTRWGHFVSTSGQGLQLLSDGTLHTLHPDGALPGDVPHSVAIGSDGTLFFAAVSPTGMLWSLQANGPWVADTIKLKLPDFQNNLVTTAPFWDDNETVRRHRLGLAIGPKGERFVLAFGGGPWQGGVQGTGVLVSTGKGNWSSWSANQDSCLGLLPPGVPQSFGVVALSARSDSTGTWISQLGQSITTPRVQFFPAGGTSRPTCLEVHESDLGAQAEFDINDFFFDGQALWLASTLGLVRVPNASPAYPPSIANGITSWPDPSSAPNLIRLTKMTLDGNTWIIAAGAGTLGAHSLGGAKTDTFFTLSGVDQVYTALSVDALGQLWAGGDQGLDIYSVSLDENNHPSFQRIGRRVTKLDGLPDNKIVGLHLDPASGKALIATADALSLWTSPYRPVPVRLAKSGIKVWPNPVRLRQNHTLFVDGATSGANFDLVAADGTLVLHKDHSKSSYGLFQIDLPTDMSKLRPGVYYWSLKDSKNSAHGPLLIGE
jgi:hypothetical protein